MKRYLLVALVGLGLIGCGESEEQKEAKRAKAIIEIQMLVSDSASYHLMRDKLVNNFPEITGAKIDKDGNLFVGDKKCVNFKINPHSLIATKVGDDDICAKVLDDPKVVKALKTNLNKDKQTTIKFSAPVFEF